MYGDSVTESILLPNFWNTGLVPLLARDETRLGFAEGGQGLIPATPYQWKFDKWIPLGQGTAPADGWTVIGGVVERVPIQPGVDGPSGFSAVATSPQASASTTVSDPDVQVLYTSTTQHCDFTVTAAGRSWAIDTYRPGPVDAAESALVLPAGRHTLTVHGPSCGLLSFSGIVAQRPVPAGKTQVEIDNLGHFAKLPWIDLQPRVEDAIVEQHYDVSVFLYGYIGELYVNPGQTATDYADALMTRALMARLDGGSCLIVAPAPMPVGKAAISLIAGLERGVARKMGCTYSTALTHLWNPDVAEQNGWLAVDGVHPTASGYHLMAAALAPVIARAVRARLGARS
jgi:hypothetical protein